MVINTVEAELLVLLVSRKLYFYEHSSPTVRRRCKAHHPIPGLEFVNYSQILPVPVLPNVRAICALTEGSPHLILTGKLLTQLCHKVGSRTERDESFGAWGCGRVLGHGRLPAAILFLPQCGLFAAAMVIHILALKSF